MSSPQNIDVLTAEEAQEADALIAAALREDLGEAGDITSQVLIAPDARGAVQIVARQTGVLAGLPLVPRILARIDPRVEVALHKRDGESIQRGDVIAELRGSVRALLAAERTILNFLTLLSGVASLTRRYVDAVAATRAVILDTRKTLPGYRRLQKYAVRCGGGRNHRLGLFDAVLIKDNHLAAWTDDGGRTLGEAVALARREVPPGLTIEIEVDSLEQFGQILPAGPDIVLLDNMTIPQLHKAVAMRAALAPQVQLEASGGVTLDSVRAIAETGVDSISAGALTHSAPACDLGFDWV